MRTAENLGRLSSGSGWRVSTLPNLIVEVLRQTVRLLVVRRRDRGWDGVALDGSGERDH